MVSGSPRRAMCTVRATSSHDGGLDGRPGGRSGKDPVVLHQHGRRAMIPQSLNDPSPIESSPISANGPTGISSELVCHHRQHARIASPRAAAVAYVECV